MIIIKTRHLYFLQYLHDSLLQALFDNKEKSVVNIFFHILILYDIAVPRKTKSIHLEQQ